MNTTGENTGTNHVVRHVSGVLAALALALTGLVAFAVPASAVSQSSAESQFKAAGVSWTSTGGCTDKNKGNCTSFSGIRQDTIDGAKTLKSASGCALTITGGTETGHAPGTYSHGNGYKLDFRLTSCLSSYITGHFSYIGKRSDGAAMYQSASGNIYAKEGSHWDVTFKNCGGC